MLLFTFNRTSVNDSLLNRIDHSSDIPGSSNSNNNYSTPGVPLRSVSVKQTKLNVSHDSLNSDSGDSDTTNNRRSGSGDRHEV